MLLLLIDLKIFKESGVFMKKKYIEKLGIELPLLAFGCMRFPTKDNKIDFEPSKEMIHHAMSNGLNYFDTAYPYHDGESENFLGKVLTDFPRESYFLANKLPIWKIENEDDAEKYFNEQLKKCQTEYFDFYLLHAMGTERVEIMEKFNLYDFIKKKKDEGKIKYMGFSFHDKNDVLEKLVSDYKWDFVQLQINYWDYSEDDAKEAYEIVAKKDIPCFVMEPVRGGFLSSFSPQVEKYMKDYSPDKSVASWAIRWVESLPNVAIVLSGMSNMEQLKDNIETVSNFKPINDDELKVLDTVIEELRKIKPVPCTGCRYCMDCSFGVNIPEIFEIYNNYKKTENKDLAYKAYFGFLSEKARASNCTKCGECVTKCPQHINIPEELEIIEKELSKLISN